LALSLLFCRSENKISNLKGKLDGYKQKLSEIENLYEDHLRMIKLWYQIKKSEIECQYDIEQRTALQEYQEKRKEIKDNLKHEYEEKRRAIENEKHALDINLDSNEPKPTITRKLRRRVNQSQTNLNQHDLQFTSLILNSSIATPNTSHIALNSCIQLNSSVQMQNSLNIQSIVNIAQTQEQQRKRRPSPSTQIACTLNDDEICDDLKYLNKNSNLLPSQIFSVFNSMQQNDDIKFDVLSNC
jgi:hypothetical protein